MCAQLSLLLHKRTRPLSEFFRELARPAGFEPATGPEHPRVAMGLANLAARLSET